MFHIFLLRRLIIIKTGHSPVFFELQLKIFETKNNLFPGSLMFGKKRNSGSEVRLSRKEIGTDFSAFEHNLVIFEGKIMFNSFL